MPIVIVLALTVKLGTPWLNSPASCEFGDIRVLEVFGGFGILGGFGGFGVFKGLIWFGVLEVGSF